MQTFIENELNDFMNYHKNIVNISFHILCGSIFMSFLFLLLKKHAYIAILLYTIFVYLSLNHIILSLCVLFSLLIFTIGLKQFKLSMRSILMYSLIFYFLPDLTHILTNEKTVLKVDSLLSILTNIVYLLPFSILSLFNIK